MAMRVEIIPAAEVSRGYQQVTGASATALITLTAPAAISGQASDAQYARMTVQGVGTLRYRCDGVPATISLGMPMVSGNSQLLALPDWSKFSAIGTATTVELNVEFFAEP